MNLPRASFELLKKSFSMFFRDRQSTVAIFFSPVVMMVILGFVVAGLSGGTDSVKVRMAVFAAGGNKEAYLPMIKEESDNEEIGVIFVDSEEELERMLRSGAVQLGISAEASKMTFLYNQSFGQYNNYLMDLQSFISNSAIEKLSGIPEYIGLQSVPVETGSSLTVIGFIAPGALAIAMMMAGVLSMATTLGTYRENGSIKRLRTTPLRGDVFVFSLALNRLWPAILSSYFTVAVSEWIFSTGYAVNWLDFTVLTGTSLCLALGIGTVFSLAFADLWTTLSFSTSVLVVMMLFSNVFYPFSIMPGYMRTIARFLPITYFSDGLRYALGIEPMYPWKFLSINLAFTLSGLSMIVFGGRALFRFERK